MKVNKVIGFDKTNRRSFNEVWESTPNLLHRKDYTLEKRVKLEKYN